MYNKSLNLKNFVFFNCIFLMLYGNVFPQSFSNNKEVEITEIFIDTTSIEVIEWGDGLYMHH